MMSPNAETIEEAASQIGSLPDWLRKSQRGELSSFGDERARQIGATGLSEDFKVGYELGLQVARGVIASSPTIILAGVDSSKIL